MRLFLIVFFVIYGGMHLYVFLRACVGLGLGTAAAAPLAAFMLFMFVAPMLVRLAERAGHEPFARVLSWVAFVWLGFVFVVVCTLLATDVLRLALWVAGHVGGRGAPLYILPQRAAFLLPLALAALVYSYGFTEARTVRTEHITVQTDKLPPGVQSFRVVQISDVHLGLMLGRQRLEGILQAVRRLRPDMLVSTGDLVDGQPFTLNSLDGMFRSLRAPHGKFAITGNHEFYAGLEHLASFIRASGFRLLRAEAVSGVINVAGVDDPTAKAFGLGTGTEEAELLKSLPREKFTLLLKHRARIGPRSSGLFDLQLSGHNHRGQIFPFSLIVKMVYPYLAGYYDTGNGSALYVSRGSGTWGPPVRVLSPPEVTLIELKRPDATAAGK